MEKIIFIVFLLQFLFL